MGSKTSNPERLTIWVNDCFILVLSWGTPFWLYAQTMLGACGECVALGVCWMCLSCVFSEASHAQASF